MHPSAPTQRLRLASHVRACESDGVVILLDLRGNKYLGIGDSQSKALATHVEGWPGHPQNNDASVAPTGCNALIRRLVGQGLLTGEPPVQHDEVALEEPTSSLDLDATDMETRISGRRLCRLLQSAATTALWMRFRSLHAIAAATAARRARLQGTSSDSGWFEAARGGAIAYERLRPFVFTAHENCLQDSLTLVGFLASEGAFARWVVGVKTRPFGAHSWVQSGATVLNDQHENVRRFRPILVV